MLNLKCKFPHFKFTFSLIYKHLRATRFRSCVKVAYRKDMEQPVPPEEMADRVGHDGGMPGRGRA